MNEFDRVLFADDNWSSFSSEEPIEYHEVHLAGTDVARKGGKILKGILRTGEWDVTPTLSGKVKRPLKIVATGKSDRSKGIISIEEIVRNFNEKKAVKRVLIPFSDKRADDHVRDGNMARVNTGFVTALSTEQEGDTTHLIAELDFKDEDVKKMALSGAVDDVSSGIPFHPDFGAFLEHVCLTPTPFIEGLKPYLAASDAPAAVQEAEVVHHVLKSDEPPADPPEVKPEEKPELTFREIAARAQMAITEQLGLSGYNVQDGTSRTITVSNEAAGNTWTVPYWIDGDSISVAPLEHWVLIKKAEETPPPAKPAPTNVGPSTSKEELENAQALREQKFTGSAATDPQRRATVPGFTKEQLDGLQLSDEARAAFMDVLAENEELAKSSRTTDVDKRIEELKSVGFSDRPSFLKLYRRLAIGDDGGVAVIALSDDGKEEKKTVREVLDEVVASLQGAEGKVTFSDQHTQSGSDVKPPNEDEGTKAPVAERVKEASSFLFPNGR